MDSVDEILPVPPFPKEETEKPPFVKGATRSAGGFGSVAGEEETFANSINMDVLIILLFFVPWKGVIS